MKYLTLFLILTSSISFAKEPLADAKLQPPLASNLWIEMSRLTQPGVVSVYLDIRLARPQMRRDPLYDFLEEFFGRGFQYEDPRNNEESSPIGTGFIIDMDGHIVTNYHVIEAVDSKRHNTKLQVQIQGESKLLDVKVLGRDPRGDLALLKLKNPPKNLKPLQFGDSDNLKVGEYVAAFGNPYGHSNSMTVGVVSAKGRAIKELNRFPFIQTDASINPGNSGGPLLNTKGYVIGVNTAIDARAQGIGFAIPSNYAKKIVESLKAGRPIQRGFLGIGMADLHPRVARSYGIKERGIVVTQVEPGFPAAKAGLKQNDIIYEFDGSKVKRSDQFVDLVQDTEVGKTVKMKVLRPTETEFIRRTFDVTLTSFPGQGEQPVLSKGQAQRSPKPKKPDSKYKSVDMPYSLGFSVVESSSGARRAFDVPIRFPFGPIISQVSPNSPADRGGFKMGYVILRVNGKGVNSTQEIIKALRPGVNRFWVHTPMGEKKISLKGS